MNMGLKVMPRSYKGLKFILVVIDVVTSYLIAISIHQLRSEEMELPSLNILSVSISF